MRKALLPVLLSVMVVGAPSASASTVPQYIVPPTPPAFTPGPVGPVSTPADPIQVFGPLQTANSSTSSTNPTLASPNAATDAFCQAEPAATALAGSTVNYAGRLVCGGAVGSTEVQICPAKYYSGGWHTFTGSRCRTNKGFGSISVGTTQGCDNGYYYHTWIWDYVPELNPSITVGNSAAVLCHS